MELGGQRKGPLSLRDIQSLLEKGAVFPSTLVTSNEPGAKPVSIQEVLRSLSVVSGQPRPRSSQKQEAFSDYGSDDPVTDLFNTYQAAKERNSTRASISASPPAAPQIDVSVIRWRWMAFTALGGLLLAGAVHLVLNVKKALGPDEREASVVGGQPLARITPPSPTTPSQSTPPTAVPAVSKVPLTTLHNETRPILNPQLMNRHEGTKPVESDRRVREDSRETDKRDRDDTPPRDSETRNDGSTMEDPEAPPSKDPANPGTATPDDLHE